MTTKRPDRDSVDDMLDVWVREIADLDPITEGIVERIEILAWNFSRSLDETLAEFDLEHRFFSLLMKLRRVGPPYRASAGKLASDLRLSSGALTNRLDRMEEAGLIRRLPDPTDRRGTIVEPTALGLEKWDKTVSAQARREALFSSVLSADERERLHGLLRNLMLAFPKSKHGKHAGDQSEVVEEPAAKKG